MSTLVLPAETKKTQPRWLYIVLCVAFCGLYFLRDILDLPISYYLIYALAMFIVLTVSRGEVIAFVISMAAFTGAGFDGIFCTMLLGCVLLRFYNCLQTVKLYSIALICMCVFELIHFLVTDKTGFGAIQTYVMALLILFVIQQCPNEIIDKKLVVNSFIAFSLFFVLMTLVQMIQAVGSLKALLESGYRVEEYTELRDTARMMANQNYITSLCSLNLCLCILMLTKKMPKIPYIVFFALFMLSGFLTVSKMFLVILIAFAAYLVVISMKKSLTRGITTILLIAFVVFVVMQLLGDNLIEIIRHRFETEELTSGRIRIVEDMLAYMKEHPAMYFVGTGIIPVHYISDKAVHSSFFEILGGWGVLGLILVVAYIVGLVKDARYHVSNENREITGYNYLPLLVYLSYSLIGMLFSSAFAVIKLMVCIYALQLKGRDEEDDVQHHNAGV